MSIYDWPKEEKLRIQALMALSHRELVGLVLALEQDSVTDYLTGVYTRRYLFEHASAFFWGRRKRNDHRKNGNYPPTVLFIDIDHFKKVNDTYGHDIGDKVLFSVASALKNSVRTRDVVARFGGEEFVACLVDVDKGAAGARAETIREAVEALRFDPDGFQITVSIGVASRRKGLDDLEDFLKAADHAMYVAKRMGRNRVVHYDDVAE